MSHATLHTVHTAAVPHDWQRQRRRAWALGAGLLLLCAVLAVVGLSVGSTGWTPVWSLLAGAEEGTDVADAALNAQIVWDIRAPRTLGAFAAGALLGLAGAVAQGLFRNPLADPFLLGSASGATLGVATALAVMGGLTPGLHAASSLGAGGWAVRLGLTGAAFAGSVGAVLLTLALARGVQHTLRLLLAGVVVGVVLGAISSLVTLLAPDILQAMQGFMLGSTGFVGWTSVGVMAAVGLPCLGAALTLSRLLDGLSLGETTAASLGLPLAPLRAALVAVLALATGTAVAQTGLIAFVGLAAPHLVRSAVRCTHGALLLLASLMGGTLLLLADTLARWVLAPQELPVGVLTAVLGGGYLLWLMHRRVG